MLRKFSSDNRRRRNKKCIGSWVKTKFVAKECTAEHVIISWLEAAWWPTQWSMTRNAKPGNTWRPASVQCDQEGHTCRHQKGHHHDTASMQAASSGTRHKARHPPAHARHTHWLARGTVKGTNRSAPNTVMGTNCAAPTTVKGLNCMVLTTV